MFRLTGGIAALIALAQLVLIGFAFVDAAVRRESAFVAADKQTKKFWLIILGLALLVVLFGFSSAFGFLSILGTIAALVYVVDARPALRQVGGRGGRGGGTMGPYGPW